MDLALSPPSAQRAQTSRWALHIAWMCLLEARPCVLLIFLLRFLAGVVMSAPGVTGIEPLRILAAAVAWELAVFFAYLINGVMDVQEDRINGSRRPIASGALSPNLAMPVALAAAAVSLACSIAVGKAFAWTVVALLVLGCLYSGPPAFLKRRPLGATITVVIYGFLSYYAGSTAHGGDAWKHQGVLFLFAGAMSLWMGLVGLPAKDLPDVKGDTAAGRRTLPVVCGETRVRLMMSAAAWGLACAFCVIAMHAAPALIWAAVVMLGGAAVVTAATLSQLSRGNRARRGRPSRMFMTMQYLANLSVLAPVAG
jgi:4-hydroxybenzoate polyprenyltransferase